MIEDLKNVRPQWILKCYHFCLLFLCASRRFAREVADAASASASSSSRRSTLLGGASESCFRGARVGEQYEYGLTTELFFEKSHLSDDKVQRMHRRDLQVELEARVTPVADDESGALHVRLEILAAHLVDSDGWQAYDEDGDAAGVDPTAADAQLLEALQRDFYYTQVRPPRSRATAPLFCLLVSFFLRGARLVAHKRARAHTRHAATQHCTMEVTDIHYPDDEAAFAVNLKNQLVKSFSHRLANDVEADAETGVATYTQNERDHLGEKRVTYEHVPPSEMMKRRRRRDAAVVPDDVLTVVAQHNDPRSVPMSVKGLDGERAPSHHVDLDQTERKQTQFRDGVVVGIELEQLHEFPGKATKDEMATQANAAANVHYDTSRLEQPPHTDARSEHDERFAASSAGFQMRSGGSTRIALRAQRRRHVADAEVRSFAAFAAVRHGDSTRFVSRSPHAMLNDRDVRERMRSAADDPTRSVADLATVRNVD